MDAITTPDAVTFDFQKLSARDRYKLMIERWCTAIALVTTVDPEGKSTPRRSACFQLPVADPPIPRVGVEKPPGMSFKHTAHNIR